MFANNFQEKLNWIKLALAVLLGLSLSLLFVLSSSAQAGQPGVPTDDEVNGIAKQLYCPVCPNTPLDVCETKACQDWRAQIKDQLSQGWNDERIMAYFVEQYGERVLAEPKRAGFTSLVWMLPVMGVVLGLAFVWQVLKSWRKDQGTLGPAAGAEVEIHPEVLARLEKELREMD